MARRKTYQGNRNKTSTKNILFLIFLVIVLIASLFVIMTPKTTINRASCRCTGPDGAVGDVRCNQSGNVAQCVTRFAACYWYQVKKCQYNCNNGVCDYSGPLFPTSSQPSPTPVPYWPTPTNIPCPSPPELINYGPRNGYAYNSLNSMTFQYALSSGNYGCPPYYIVTSITSSSTSSDSKDALQSLSGWCTLAETKLNAYTSNRITQTYKNNIACPSQDKLLEGYHKYSSSICANGVHCSTASSPDDYYFCYDKTPPVFNGNCSIWPVRDANGKTIYSVDWNPAMDKECGMGRQAYEVQISFYPDFRELCASSYRQPASWYSPANCYALKGQTAYARIRAIDKTNNSTPYNVKCQYTF